MKSQYDHIRSFVVGASAVWQVRLGLSHVNIEHVFLDSQFGEATSDDFLITACAETRWNYLEAKIKWYLPSAVRHSDERLEATLVHELCHVLLAPEQGLLDVKLEEARSDLAGQDFDTVQGLMYERMELATEMASRAIMRGYALHP